MTWLRQIKQQQISTKPTLLGAKSFCQLAILSKCQPTKKITSGIKGEKQLIQVKGKELNKGTFVKIISFLSVLQNGTLTK